MGKHVIFLGAGASASSGFPLAADLTLRMISPRDRSDYCHSLFKSSFPQEGIDFTAKIKVAVDLFASGSFSSVDEFCKLATGSPNFAVYIPQLKQLMRLILSIDNPVENFNTDYRWFVNRMFKDDGVSLRDNIAVLSFNYDTHLDYLLADALNTRYKVQTSLLERGAPVDILDSVTSGFWSHGESDWNNKSGFCLLKLHGSLGYPYGGNGDVCWDDLFKGTYAHRVKRLSNSDLHVPCIFPWEMMKGDTFMDQREFCLKIKPANCAKDVYTIFRDTWERARSEITKAKKISFVGMSMHPYLEEGLRFLFGRRTFPPQSVVSAGPGNKGFEKPLAAQGFPLTPASRTKQFFRRNFKHWTISEQNEKPFEGDVNVIGRDSFKDFIAKDL